MEIRWETKACSLFLENIQIRVIKYPCFCCRDEEEVSKVNQNANTSIGMKNWLSKCLISFISFSQGMLWTHWRDKDFCLFWFHVPPHLWQRCLSRLSSQDRSPGDYQQSHEWWSWKKLSDIPQESLYKENTSSSYKLKHIIILIKVTYMSLWWSFLRRWNWHLHEYIFHPL